MSFKNAMFKALFFRQLLWCVFAIALIIFSLGISWQANKSANFFYGFWYQTLEIHAVINKNVPKNSQGKRDFPVDDFELHQEKFADIVQAIHQQGMGLDDITYLGHHDIAQKLLTVSEVQHLQDVANLLSSMVKFWWGNLFFLLMLVVFYCRKKNQQTLPTSHQLIVASASKMPTGKQKLIVLASFVLLVIFMLWLWGFTPIFYYLHTVIFPADHQWFFYYNESLMATIMKAPDIFAAIATQLVVVALLIAGTIDVIVSRYQNKTKKYF
tara:strand:- start:1925 stop:2731 length:807 start_codon:yes stop_codon:yes gene_type:complete